MKSEEFKAWLEAGGAKTEAGRNTPAYAVRTIQNNLAALGSPHRDLDEAWAADRFEYLRRRLKELREDFFAGGTDYRMLMPQSESPERRLSSWRSWLGQYGQFLSGEPRGDRDADVIRRHVLETYIEPAREQEAETADVLVRDVNQALGLNQAWPNICQALAGPKFLEMADVPPPERIGADQSSATVFRFDLTGLQGSAEREARPFLLFDARGEAYQPVRNFNRSTGRSAFRIKPVGADNSTDAALEVETVLDVARAMLVEGRPSRVRAISGGPVNYLAYGKQKLVRYQLDPAIAAQIGVPATGSVENTDNLMTDEEILARFTKKPAFKSWLANWTEEQRASFLRIVRLTHDAGLDWYHVNLGRQVRFGRKKPGAIDATEVFGSISKVDPVAWIRRAEDRAALGLNDDWLSLEECAEALGASPHALNRFSGQRGLWPDEVAPDQGSDSDSDRIAARRIDQPLPTNLILYGPPGTGKTFATARRAVELCGEVAPAGRDELMAVYRSLQQKGRIAFVTFHQSYSYEEFVEGLRPVSGGGEGEGPVDTGFSLQPQDGIFKQIADVAASNRGRAAGSAASAIDRNAKIFKMSLGRSWASEDDAIFQDAIRDGYVVLGWGGEIDWSDSRYDKWDAIAARWREDHPEASGNDPNITQLYALRANMQTGSTVVISDGNRKFRAIGRITGPYQFVRGPNGEYNHRRAVDWLWHSNESLPRELIYNKELSQVSAYQMNSRQVNWDGLEQVVASGGDAGTTTGEPEPYVLIIDEINRANISRVFGELITLLEPDKRLGQTNELTVKLPYSKTEFGVPANLHIIGTMNTADRSIALLDTALRRRFRFEELMPNAALLGVIDGIDLRRLLSTINERIEYLFDREHQVGHAYFMGCVSRSDVDAAMRHKIIPLLAEYFYEDWGKVARVLGDDGQGDKGFLKRERLEPPPEFGEQADGGDRYRWRVRAEFDYSAFAV